MSIIQSKWLYPLWRIGWLERFFFLSSRLFQKTQFAAFYFYNFGFDVSKYQAVIDFVKMAAYGAKFLIMRCAYGITTDQRFLINMLSAPNSFGALSVYHYYDPIYSPVEQANKVVSILAPYKSKIRRVWLDLEFYWTGAYSDPKHWKTYRDIIKSAGYKVGWYSRATWWDSRVGSYAAEFAQDPCWAAQYNTQLTLIPKGWTKAMIWQKGTPAIGAEAGVGSAEIDLDIWNDEYNFALEWGTNGGGTTPPPDTGGATVTTYNLTATGDPTKQFANADGSDDVGPNIQKGTSLKAHARNGVTYGLENGKYVKYNQVRLDSIVEDPVPPPPTDPPPAPPPSGEPVTVIKGVEQDYDENGVLLSTWDVVKTKRVKVSLSTATEINDGGLTGTAYR